MYTHGGDINTTVEILGNNEINARYVSHCNRKEERLCWALHKITQLKEIAGELEKIATETLKTEMQMTKDDKTEYQEFSQEL